jgi:hypothetical protein
MESKKNMINFQQPNVDSNKFIEKNKKKIPLPIDLILNVEIEKKTNL